MTQTETAKTIGRILATLRSAADAPTAPLVLSADVYPAPMLAAAIRALACGNAHVAESGDGLVHLTVIDADPARKRRATAELLNAALVLSVRERAQMAGR